MFLVVIHVEEDSKIRSLFHTPRASLVAQRVNNLPAMQEIWVCSLGWEDLE